MNMDPKTIRKLEKELEKAIVEVVCRIGLKRLPSLCSQKTMQWMAKAAVAVYKAQQPPETPFEHRPHPEKQGVP
jgi:hypothetical protein